MEDSILLFWEEGRGKAEDDCTLLFLSISCSAMVSPYYITLNSPPKPPNAFRKKITKSFFFNKIQQTVKSSSNSTHYQVLTN